LESYGAYGFITASHSTTIPFCIFCEKTFSNSIMKLGTLKKHFTTVHPDKEDLSLEKRAELINNFKTRKTILKFIETDAKVNEDLLKTSFEISLLIAKTGKPHTIAKTLIQPAISSFLRNVLKMNDEKISQLPLSNDSVRRRIDCMSDNVESQLIQILRVKKFSLQLDESTVRDSQALLLAYVRYVDNGEFKEEMLFCNSLEGKTTAIDIFKVLNEYLSKNEIPFNNIISCAADGAPSMMGKRNGCLQLIKQKNPDLLIVHCVIHRENLVAKKLAPELNLVLSSIIRCINRIKTNPMTERLFKQFCQSLDADHVKLLLYTEVRWLSRGTCLLRFVEMYENILAFLYDDECTEFLKNEDNKNMTFYLANIFKKFNFLNKQLQGRKTTLLDVKQKISSFISSIKLMRFNVENNNMSDFSNLSNLFISYNVKKIILKHLDMIVMDFRERFEDLRNLKFPEWMLCPIEVDVCTIECQLQPEFLEIQNDEIFKVRFNTDGV
ncbi:SCAN domain-containing protein 3, partial [Dictyocoela muelleri]